MYSIDTYQIYFPICKKKNKKQQRQIIKHRQIKGRLKLKAMRSV